MSDLSKYKKLIVGRLNQWEAYGGTYKNIQRIQQAFPSYERDMTKINKALSELRKEGVIIFHKKNTCIGLNTKMKSLIRGYILDC